MDNYATKYLGETVSVKIDRPVGSKHPKHGFVYEVNYGFVPNTKAPDGEEIDAYILGVDKPVDEFTGKCIAIIHRLDDNDDKLVIVPENTKEISDEEILRAVNFQEKYFKFETLRKEINKAITKKEAIKIVKEFLKTKLERKGWFSNVKPHIKAFILYGSVAKGTNRPDSDIDIMLILPLETEKKYTEGEYFYDYQGQKINIVLRSIEKLRRIAEEKNDQFQKEVFRKSEILIDRDGEIRGLLKEIGKT